MSAFQFADKVISHTLDEIAISHILDQIAISHTLDQIAIKPDNGFLFLLLSHELKSRHFNITAHIFLCP